MLSLHKRTDICFQWFSSVVPSLWILEIFPKVYGFIGLPSTFCTLNTVSQSTASVFSDYKRLGSTIASTKHYSAWDLQGIEHRPVHETAWAEKVAGKPQ